MAAPTAARGYPTRSDTLSVCFQSVAPASGGRDKSQESALRLLLFADAVRDCNGRAGSSPCARSPESQRVSNSAVGATKRGAAQRCASCELDPQPLTAH
jgi:hypothetical protein